MKRNIFLQGRNAFNLAKYGKYFKALPNKTLVTLSKLAKSFLLPISLLPIAGIFIGVGAAITTQIAKSYGGDAALYQLNGGWIFGNVLNQMGSICFANLAVLFCISTVIAFSKDIGTATIAGLIAFLVFNAFIGGLSFQHTHKGVITYSLLFYKAIPKSLYSNILGINSLNTGVFAGIVVGCITSYVYNRTYKIQLPKFISFFSGVRFVPIILFIAIVPLALLFAISWPVIGIGLNSVGKATGDLPYGFDALIFEIFERSLVPFGLHHVFYAPLWWTSAGGGPLSSVFHNIDNWVKANREAGGFAQNAASLAGISGFPGSGQPFILWFFHASSYDQLNQGSLNILGAGGDQKLLYAILSSNYISFTNLHQLQLFINHAYALDPQHFQWVNVDNIGRFQTGKFPFMMFGLTAAAVAMYLSAPKAKRRSCMGIYFSAAATCFLTGITEPIEYTFLFVAPWLFYGIHMPLATISFWLMGLLKVHVGQTVSGGFIDCTIFGIIPFSAKGTNFYWIFIVGPAFSVAYFFLFYFLIKKFNVPVPGREELGGGSAKSPKLYTKMDYRKKKYSGSKEGKEIEKLTRAMTIYEALGESKNITFVDACASRLRISVKDISLVQKEKIKALGPSAVIVRGLEIQSIFSGESDILKTFIREIIKDPQAARDKISEFNQKINVKLQAVKGKG